MAVNLAPNTKERSQIEGIWEQGAEENIWTYKGGRDGKMENTA
jgi:hypothetical protein